MYRLCGRKLWQIEAAIRYYREQELLSLIFKAMDNKRLPEKLSSCTPKSPVQIPSLATATIPKLVSNTISEPNFDVSDSEEKIIRFGFKLWIKFNILAKLGKDLTHIERLRCTF